MATLWSSLRQTANSFFSGIANMAQNIISAFNDPFDVFDEEPELVIPTIQRPNVKTLTNIISGYVSNRKFGPPKKYSFSVEVYNGIFAMPFDETEKLKLLAALEKLPEKSYFIVSSNAVKDDDIVEEKAEEFYQNPNRGNILISRRGTRGLIEAKDQMTFPSEILPKRPEKPRTPYQHTILYDYSHAVEYFQASSPLEYGSDVFQSAPDLIRSGSITFYRPKEEVFRNEGGAYKNGIVNVDKLFKNLNMLKIPEVSKLLLDLSVLERLQIFTTKTIHLYKGNVIKPCLVNAIMNAINMFNYHTRLDSYIDLTYDDVLKAAIPYMSQGYVKERDIKCIAEKLGITIAVSRLSKNATCISGSKEPVIDSYKVIKILSDQNSNHYVHYPCLVHEDEDIIELVSESLIFKVLSELYDNIDFMDNVLNYMKTYTRKLLTCYTIDETLLGANKIPKTTSTLFKYLSNGACHNIIKMPEYISIAFNMKEPDNSQIDMSSAAVDQSRRTEMYNLLSTKRSEVSKVIGHRIPDYFEYENEYKAKITGAFKHYLESEYGLNLKFQQYNTAVMNYCLKHYKFSSKEYSEFKDASEVDKFNQELCQSATDGYYEKIPPTQFINRLYTVDKETYRCTDEYLKRKDAAVPYSISFTVPMDNEKLKSYTLVDKIKCLELPILDNPEEPLAVRVLKCIGKFHNTYIQDWIKRYYFPKGAKTISERMSCFYETYGMHITPIVYAHNNRFDMSSFTPYFTNISGVIDKSKFKRFIGKYENYTYEFRDSYCIIPMKVDDMAGAYKLDVKKLYYNYDFYNQENTTKMLEDINFKVSNEVFFGNSLDSVIKSLKELKDDYKAIYMLEDIATGYISPLDYCILYNEYDVITLHKAIIANFKMWLTGLGIDITNKLTVAGASSALVEKYGCFKNVSHIHGSLSESIRSNMVGGWCQIRDSRMYKTKKTANAIDLDVNSEYPWAQQQGFPMGLPEYQTPGVATLDYPGEYWIANVLIKSMPKDSPFSVICRRSMGGGGKDFQHLKGDISEGGISYLVDNNFAEVMKLEGFTDENYTVLEGIRFTGINITIRYVTQWLYRKRQLLKLEKNCLEKLYKNVLNSIWGRCGMRSFNEDVSYYDNYDTALKEISKNPILFKEMWRLEDPHNPDALRYVVESKQNAVTKYSSRAFIAVMVLNRSKLLLTRYIRTAEEAGMKFIYCDTDSLQMEIDKTLGINNILDKFSSICVDKYQSDPMKAIKLIDFNNQPVFDAKGNPVMIDELGALKVDYEPESDFGPYGKYPCTLEYGGRSSDVCSMGIWIAPKTYLSIIERTNPNGTKRYYPHARAKGINKEVLFNKAFSGLHGKITSKIYCDAIYKIYDNLYEGKQISFSWASAGKISFKYNKGICYYHDQIRVVKANLPQQLPDA